METLEVARSGGVVTVTMNRPHRKNAANGTMWQELLATFREIADSSEDRVMVLTGKVLGLDSTMIAGFQLMRIIIVLIWCRTALVLFRRVAEWTFGKPDPSSS